MPALVGSQCFSLWQPVFFLCGKGLLNWYGLLKCKLPFNLHLPIHSNNRNIYYIYCHRRRKCKQQGPILAEAYELQYMCMANTITVSALILVVKAKS